MTAEAATLTPDAALTALRAEADAGRAGIEPETGREVLGLRVARISELTAEWRMQLGLEDRLTLAEALWQMDIQETRIAAVKLLTQARIQPDQGYWQLLTSWLLDCDSLAMADLMGDAGARRLLADPSRLDEVESWTRSRHLWTKRAALVVTLPWAKKNNLKPADLQARDRILDWASAYLSDKDPVIQTAVAVWIRDLSKHDPQTARAFLDEHGARMKPFARKEASKHLA